LVRLLCMSRFCSHISAPTPLRGDLEREGWGPDYGKRIGAVKRVSESVNNAILLITYYPLPVGIIPVSAGTEQIRYFCLKVSNPPTLSSVCRNMGEMNIVYYIFREIIMSLVQLSRSMADADVDFTDGDLPQSSGLDI
jgi:hypothetical protein